MGLDLRPAVDPLTGFGNRVALTTRLEDAVDPSSDPSVLAVFGLDGLDEFEKTYGVASADNVIARLAEEFERMVTPEGVCFTPRRREFCAVFGLPLTSVWPILTATAIALRREGAMTLIRASFGIAVLPEQADDSVGALIVADRNLNQARRAQRNVRSSI